MVTPATTESIVNIWLDNKSQFTGRGNYVGVPRIITKADLEAKTWWRGNVCKKGFGENEANFLCRKSGFPDGGTFTTHRDLEEKYRRDYGWNDSPKTLPSPTVRPMQ